MTQSALEISILGRIISGLITADIPSTRLKFSSLSELGDHAPDSDWQEWDIGRPPV